MRNGLGVAATLTVLAASGGVPDTELGHFFPPGNEVKIPIGNCQTVEFTLPKAAPGSRAVRLEFDGRIDYPGIDGHNDTALALYVNDQLVPARLLVNCPLEFRRANGHTGEAGRWMAPRWNFDQVKTNEKYADLLLRQGGDLYGLVYAENFDWIDGPRHGYRSPGYSRKHLVFDITAMCRPGVNTVVFRNNLPPEAVGLMGDRSPLPLVLRDIRVGLTDEPMVKPRAFWLEELDAANREMPWIAPRKEWKEPFSQQVRPDGALAVGVGGRQYLVTSTFSYPGPRAVNGFPRPASAEADWKIVREDRSGGAVRLRARGRTYTVDREIVPGADWIEIRDTVSNPTAAPQPILIRNRVALPSGHAVFLSGLKVAENQIAMTYLPENPTAFAEFPDGSGLGMTPYDDVSRIHGQVFQIGNSMELRDAQFVLAPGKSVTLNWQLFPVASGGYSRFLNNLRHHWGLASPEVSGIWSIALQPVAENWQPDAGTEYVFVPNNLNGATFWGRALADNTALQEKMRAVIASVRKAAPGLEIIPNYMAIYFSNGGDRDLELFKDCALVRKDGGYLTEDGCRFFIPTKDNAFGKMVESTVDRMLGWGGDGIYFDYMEGADPYFTYNQYDGVSGDIDEAAGTLIAAKGSYQLLSQDFLIRLVKKVAAQGKKIYANRSNFTASTMNAINAVTPVRFAECGFPDQLVRGQLAPCPMGLQRTFSNRIALQVVRALYEGMLTSPYHVAYHHDDNPVTAMWPLAYREMRRGVVIGADKIVTAVSGRFGFGDASGLTARFYDADGVRRAKQFPLVQRDGANYLEVRLATGEIAVIERQKDGTGKTAEPSMSEAKK